MAVTEQFREQWLECQEEYGKNIEAGDMPVIGYGDVDETISLPAVKFTAPFDPEGTNVFDSYAHVPMKTFKKKIDDLAGEVSEATSDLVEVKQAAIEATEATLDAIENAEAATTAATNVNADLTGMTVTITNRQGVSKSVNIGFEILQEHVYPSVAAMNADAANVQAGQFCMIATTDPTSPDNAQLWSRNSSPASSDKPFTFLSDLDQASSAAFADWLNNYKPVIETDHTRAENDHSTASSDHTQAGEDHTRAGQDHSTATADHTQAGNDHTRAENDHTTADSDHRTATADHAQAGNDHTRCEEDHTQAGNDHTRAERDHATAADDHTTADSDHTQAGQDHAQSGEDHQQALQDHEASERATLGANTQANRAKGYNDHPWVIGDDGYIYVWNDGTQQMVKTNKMIIDFSDLTPEQQAAMVQEFLSHLTFDETPTDGSTNPVTSRGIKTALDQKQDTLTFASDALCASAASEIVFA